MSDKYKKIKSTLVEFLNIQEAADVLNVSHSYLIRLLEKNKMPYQKIGDKFQILSKDVLAYKAHIDKARHKALKKLSEQAQELNMGYE